MGGAASFFWAIILLSHLAAVRVAADEKSDKDSTEEKATVLFAGDIMAPARVKQVAHRIGKKEEFYFGSLLHKIKPILVDNDLVFANLETPVSRTESNVTKSFVFNAPFDFLKGLKWAGFNIVSVANNHSLDQNRIGLSETLTALKSQRISYVGADRDRTLALQGREFSVNNVSVGFLAFTALVNGGSAAAKKMQRPYLNLTERTEELFWSVEHMRKRVDVLIVSLHWGEEYQTRPRPWQKRLARELHHRGVDVIVGHHPHVLQPIEKHTAKDGRMQLTLYSLGNLISNQSQFIDRPSAGQNKFETYYARESAAVKLVFTKSGIQNYYYYPLWVDNWQSPESGIGTVVLRSEIDRLQTLASPLRPSPERSFLLDRIQVLKARLNEINATLFPSTSFSRKASVGTQ